MRLPWSLLVSLVLACTALQAAEPAASQTPPAATVATPATAPAPTTATQTYGSHVLTNGLVTVDISEFQGSIRSMSLVGSRPIKLRDWQEQARKHANVHIPDAGQPLAVLDDVNPRGGKHNWISGIELPNEKNTPPWTVVRKDAQHVTLTLAHPTKGLRYELRYELTEGHLDLVSTLTVENTGDKEWTLQPTVFPINGEHQDDPAQDATYISVAHHTGGSTGKLTSLGMPAVAGALPIPKEGLDYVSFKSRFFAALWQPLSFQLTSVQPVAGTPAPAVPAAVPPSESGGPGDGAGPGIGAPVGASPLAGVVGNLSLSAHGFAGAAQAHYAYLQVKYLGEGNGDVHLKPGQKLIASWKTTVTSTNKTDLDRLSELERKVQYTDGYYRFLKSLVWPLTLCLDAIVVVVRNYGFALVVLTFLIKLALHRTTFKQQESMMKMQKLGPDLKRLQEEYKNDKQKLAAKQMELWKKNGVNPLGGCLPILIQIPVFTALYMAFSYSAEMRGHSFLWVNDLTLPDQLLGWVIGSWTLSINPLPLIYIGVTIWMSLMQKMPTGGDPQQEQMMKMMRWMPVMFGVIFYNMPSGLVLYFTVNAVLSTLEIRMVKKKLGMA